MDGRAVSSDMRERNRRSPRVSITDGVVAQGGADGSHRPVDGPMSRSAAIVTADLVKTFGPIRALGGLDLTVQAGEVHGFLGPNGAGKSTTIRVLLGLLRADSGRAEVLGGDPWRSAVALHRRLAYVPGVVEPWPNLTGGEAIDILGRLRGGLNQARPDGCDRSRGVSSFHVRLRVAARRGGACR